MRQVTQLTDKSLSIIAVIVIPIFAGIFSYIFGYFHFENYPNPNSNYIAFITLRATQVCYLAVIVYGLYPIVFTVERFSKNYENLAKEFEFKKKSLFVGLPILVILIIIAQILTHFKITLPFILFDASFAILVTSIATVIGPLLRIAVYTAKREFRFYLARGYCEISSEKQNNFDKINYLFLSLDSYNKFLTRKTKFGIKNIDRIFSDIMHADTRKNDEMIKAINEQLSGHGMDLGIYLSKIYKVTESEQFLLKNR